MRRKSTILAPMDVGASGTKVIDIMLKEQISRISILFEVTNVTVSAMLERVVACLPKIELVDGSKVIISGSAGRLQAANYLDHKVLPEDNISLTVGGKFYTVINLDFGRYLYDEALALRPELFSNLQLKITFDEDAVNTSAVVNSMAIYADVDDAPSNGAAKGYMYVQDLKTYAMAASSHEYSSIPPDDMIKRLLVQPYSTDHSPSAMFDNIKLSIDNDAIVPYDLSGANLVKMLSHYPAIIRKYTLDGAVTTKTLFVPVSEDVDISIEYGATAFVTAQSKFAAPTITGGKIALAASVDITALTAKVSGKLPHNCIPLDFGDMYMVETWLNLGASQSIRLDLQSSSEADSADTCAIAVQAMRLY